MKTLKNLDEKPNLLEVDVPDTITAKLLTYRQELKMLISNISAKGADEALDLYNAGLKLMAEGPDCELEDSQFRILYEKVKENPLQRPVTVHAQLMCKFNDK